MVKVKLMDQLTSTYDHDRRHKTWYYLRLFFDLWDMIAGVNGNFPTETPSHLTALEPSRGQYHYCKKQGKKKNIC